MKETDLTHDSIREIAYGFQRSRVLLTAFEIGIFSAVGDRRESSESVAGKLGTDWRATDRLMNSLAGIEPDASSRRGTLRAQHARGNCGRGYVQEIGDPSLDGGGGIIRA